MQSICGRCMHGFGPRMLADAELPDVPLSSGYLTRWERLKRFIALPALHVRGACKASSLRLSESKKGWAQAAFSASSWDTSSRVDSSLPFLLIRRS
eukprot:6213726-Pleurochrysis_carterae.AAC.1